MSLNPLLMDADTLARYYVPRDEIETHLLAQLKEATDRYDLLADALDDLPIPIDISDMSEVKENLDHYIGVETHLNTLLKILGERDLPNGKELTNNPLDAALGKLIEGNEQREALQNAFLALKLIVDNSGVEL